MTALAARGIRKSFGRRGRALEEAAPGRCPGGSDTAEGIAGGGGQDVRPAWAAHGDGTGRDLA
jgi:hypothetical protein